MMKTISVTSQKGGTGKTTVTENLAGAALQAGLTVVVVDLDSQTTATNWHDRRGLDQPSAAQLGRSPRASPFRIALTR